VRREGHDRIADARVDVDSVASDGLSRHFKTGVRQVIPQPSPGRAFIPRDGFDINQFPCGLEDVYIDRDLRICGSSKNEARLK
jgi:hypothetical protein